MEQAVAPCPEVNLKAKGTEFKSLLDFGSMVSLMNESFFRSQLASSITPMTGDKVNAHQLFNLKGVEDGQVPLSKYFEMDVEIRGFKIPQVGFLVKKDNAPLLDSKGKSSRLPAIAGCNLIRLGMEEFIRQYSHAPFELFECPKDFDPLLFSTFCVYFYTEREKEQNVPQEEKLHVGVNSAGVGDANGNSDKRAAGGTSTSKKKAKRKCEGYLEGYAGMVTVGDKHQPLCIPANSSKNVMGRAKGVPYRGDFMVELADDNNLPSGLVVNRTYVQPTKSNLVPVTLMNTNDYNVWIRQPLFAGELYEVDEHKWEHETVFIREEGSDDIQVHFQPVPPENIREEIFFQTVEQKQDEQKETKEEDKDTQEEPLPKFGPCPNFDDPNFNFKEELKRLPFELNLGEAPLNREQQVKFLNIIYDNQAVFSLHDGDLGHCDVLKHSIPVSSNKPVYLPHRAIPVQLQSEVRKCLDTWLKQGIIRPSKSPYASQVVIVRKKSGEIRLCVDFRKLNAISVHDSFPLPRVEEALQAVQAAVWFSSFDLAQGYLQMAMEEADIPKTAFRAGSSGLYEFTMMPFGLTNAGASFCRLMEMCIGDQQYVTLLFYLDDICVFSETVDQMLARVALVFERLKTFNLKIKPKKSFFFQKSVTFLGHILSSEGIAPNPEKIDKVKNWPKPANPKEVHSFIGLASYYRRFIPNFAKIAGPLHALIVPASTKQKLKKGEVRRKDLPPFEWTEECQKSFDALKDALTSAPILAYPDYSKPFILETDASLKGLGAVLSQRGDDNVVRVVAYASRSLRPSEKSMRDYSSAKIELMALKWAVCEKFKDYLLGSKFTVYTDNNPIVHIQNSKLGAAQIRWISELALYDFDIVYRTGRSNNVADALSRRPADSGSDNEVTDEEEEWTAISYQTVCETLDIPLGGTKLSLELRARLQTVDTAHVELGEAEPIEVTTNYVSVFNTVLPETMAQYQRADNQIGPVIKWIESGTPPSKSDLYEIRSKLTRKMLYQFDRLILKEGVLHRLYIDQDMEFHQLVLPQRYYSKILKAVHDDMGHQALDRTLSLLRERVYWPTMAQDACEWVKGCRRCHITKSDYNEPKPKLGNLISNNPLDLLCIDFTKVDPSRTGKENVLVMTDAFTKFSQAIVTPNQKALTVAKVLVDKWFHVYGIPARIHSDQGKSFDNEILDHLCAMYGVERTMTAPYNPRGNSQCERFNRTMFNLLKTLSKEQKSDWPAHLSTMTFAYNATPHSSTGFQPYELMFGRKAPAPCDAWLGLHAYSDTKSASKSAWVDQQLEHMVMANRRALRHIKASVKKNHDRYGGKDLLIPVGNLVLLRDHPEGRHKIQDVNKSTLFVVTGLHKDPNTYYIKPMEEKGPVKTVNRRQLHDLGITQEEEEQLREAEFATGADPVPSAPVYIPKLKKLKKKKTNHDYALRSLGPVTDAKVASVELQSTRL